MKNKKGISLITLIVTIVVIVILAGAIIINLVKTNIIENAEEAVELNDKSVAKEEVRLSTYDLAIKEETTEMTQEDIKTELEEKLKTYDANSTVVLNGKGFKAVHRGQVFEISERFKIKVMSDDETNVEIERVKWDSETSDDYFKWDSTGTIIVGFTDKITGCQKLRIPTKCVAIVPDTLWAGNTNRGDISIDVKKIEIPDTVTKIGDYAFADFNILREINIPDSVTEIGNYAFYACYSLESISLPEGITKIGDYAFSYCSSLTSVILSENLTSIGKYTFGYCAELTSMIIPESVNIIDNNAFYGWTSDRIIYCDAISKPSDWESEWCGTDGVKLVWGYKILSEFDTVEWDKDATSDDAFIWDEAGTSIIGYTDKISKYEKVRIPSKCISINATSILISQDMRSILSSGVKKVELPETITSIGDHAFSEFKDLREVNIPERVTNIGRLVFNNCTSIESIIIPEGVTTTGSSVFENWTSSQTIYCKASSKPSGWNTTFDNANVVWDYKGE